MSPIGFAIFVASLCAVYLLPSIVAGFRGHASAWGIFALNLILGWTGIIWLIALIWALSNKGQANQQIVIVENHNNEGQHPAPPTQAVYVPVPQPVPQPSLPVTSPPVALIEGDTRDCPMCAETIKAAAIKCRYCGERVVPTLITQRQEEI